MKLRSLFVGAFFNEGFPMDCSFFEIGDIK